MKRMMIFLGVCFAMLSVVANGWTGQASLDVATIQVDEGVLPETCYELLRNGKPLRPLTQKMRVCNGDVIIPHKGKSVTLNYRHSDCGENGKEIVTEKMVVNCNPIKFKEPGFFAEQVSEFVNDVKEKTRKSDSPIGKEASSRAGWDLAEISLFPMNGTTLLYKSPICFKWKGKDCLPGSDAKLVDLPGGRRGG